MIRFFGEVTAIAVIVFFVGFGAIQLVRELAPTDTIMLSAKHWTCTDHEPAGCVEYRLIEQPERPQLRIKRGEK